MTFDPRTAMLDRDRPPWLADPKAEPRVDSPLSTTRGPREKRRIVFSFDLTEAYERVQRWWKRDGSGA